MSPKHTISARDGQVRLLTLGWQNVGAWTPPGGDGNRFTFESPDGLYRIRKVGRDWILHHQEDGGWSRVGRYSVLELALDAVVSNEVPRFPSSGVGAGEVSDSR